jgi:hypothetical protein
MGRAVTAPRAYAARLWGATAILYGLLVWVGGPVRWSNPVYRIVNVVPGSPYTWGSVILAAGALIITGSFAGHHRTRVVGLYLMAAWCLIFAGCFFILAVFDKHAPLTGGLFLTAISGHLLLIALADGRPSHDATHS